jgi:phospholipase C
MFKKPIALVCVLVVGAFTGCSGGSMPGTTTGSQSFPRAGATSGGKIQHIVVIVQENRSFDNFFDCFQGTDCVTTAPGPGASPGPVTAASPCPQLFTPGPGPTPAPIKIRMNVSLIVSDPAHDYCPAFKTEYDNGRMDGFYWETTCYPSDPGRKYCGNYVYRVTKPAAIQPYWDMAAQYVLGDRAFTTQGSGSYTAHQDLVAGTTQVSAGVSLIDFPLNSEHISDWGCDDAKDSKTPTIDTNEDYNVNGPFPCMTYETIRDLLDAKSISWKYYTPPWPIDGGQSWNAFDGIYAVRHDKTEWPPKFVVPFNCTGSCVSWPNTNIFCDIANKAGGKCPKPSPPGQLSLPTISWVIPTGTESDHYALNKGGTKVVDTGPDWVTSVINAIGESKYWNSTAIILTWDEWGGFYDHISPPQLDYQGLGFRVPYIIISPYAKKGYVSHTQYETYGSSLKFMESVFGLGSLGTTDARANNVTDAFDFSQQPRAFVPIAPLHKNENQSYFMNLPPDNNPTDTP